MEKFLKPYDKEFMKMAILKHEETFKQQVCELHRLYETQKAIMKSMASQNQEGCRYLKNKPRLDHQIMNRNMFGELDKPIGYNKLINDGMESDYYNDSMEVEESQIELTLGPTSFYKSTKGVETKTRTSESGPSFSSSNSTGSSHMRKIGTTWINERSFEAGEDLELNQSKIKHYPPWLYNQTLTLNLT